MPFRVILLPGVLLAKQIFAFHDSVSQVLDFSYAINFQICKIFTGAQ
jgi:hypothetical protein